MAQAPITGRTATRRKTTTPTTTRSRATRQPAAESAAADAPEAAETPPADAAAETSVTLRKKELIDRVVAASGKKKKDVKPVVEAMLGVLGASLSAGETMNLQPFGKLTINRRKDAGNGEVLVTKIRRSTQAIDATQDPLAEPAE